MHGFEVRRVVAVTVVGLHGFYIGGLLIVGVVVDVAVSGGMGGGDVIGGEFEEVGVVAGSVEELAVGAGLEDRAAVKDDDGVGVSDGGEAVGDDEGGAGGGDFVYGLLDLGLRFWVQCTCGLIQEQDLGIFDHGSGKGDPLLLAT